MEDRPPYIRAFETLQLASAFVGLIHGFAIGQVFVAIFGAVITITLTLLISRRRKNWARWTLFGTWALGLAMVVAGLFIGITQEALSTTYPVLTALVWLMQTVALALLFTPQSARWLRPDQSKALHRVFE
jgi:FtsH-binding integral membrane protein